MYIILLDDIELSRYKNSVFTTSQAAKVMHGSILPVTIPPGQPRRQVQPFRPGGGELFEAV